MRYFIFEMLYFENHPGTAHRHERSAVRARGLVCGASRLVWLHIAEHEHRIEALPQPLWTRREGHGAKWHVRSLTYFPAMFISSTHWSVDPLMSTQSSPSFPTSESAWDTRLRLGEPLWVCSDTLHIPSTGLTGSTQSALTASHTLTCLSKVMFRNQTDTKLLKCQR